MPILTGKNVKDPEREAQLKARLGAPVHAFASVGSTMDTAHALAMDGAVDGTLVWAAEQTRGRGRQGRTWHSPLGGLYIALILRPRPSVEPTSQLSLVAGLACVEAVRMVCGLSPCIRWPNDLFIKGKKLAGILVEKRDGVVIVGIGVNVAAPKEPLKEAISLSEASGRSIELIDVLAAVYERFRISYSRWELSGFGVIREQLRPWIGIFGKPVEIQMGSQNLQGVACDIDESGALVVRLDSGLMRSVGMGEVTLLR